MKRNKEILSLNSIKDDFNEQMGVDERFNILNQFEQQALKGGDDECPTMDRCLCMNGVVWGPGCPEDCSCNGYVCIMS